MKDIDLPDYEEIASDILNSVTECFASQKGGQAKMEIRNHLKDLYNKCFKDGKQHMINCMESNIWKEEGNR